MPRRPSEPVQLVDQYSVKLPTLGVLHQCVQLWTAFLAARDASVGIGLRDRPAACLAELPQAMKLAFSVLALIVRANSGIQSSFYDQVLLGVECMRKEIFSSTIIFGNHTRVISDLAGVLR